MTTAKTQKSPPFFPLPDPPEIPDEKMTAARHLSLTGNAHHLAQHLGSPETTVIDAEHYITSVPPAQLADMTGVPYPDLLVALNADPAACRARNGYVISEQGKPPDFVLEVASASTGRRDSVDKRITYAALDIPEYWRFDETGQFHGTRLAGDRLVGGQYEPIQVDELPDGSLQGYSAVLNVDVRWVDGHLVWYDPTSGEPVATFESLRQAFAQESEALNQEREARIQAETRVRELEDQIRLLRGE